MVLIFNQKGLELKTIIPNDTFPMESKIVLEKVEEEIVRVDKS